MSIHLQLLPQMLVGRITPEETPLILLNGEKQVLQLGIQLLPRQELLLIK